MHFYEIENVKIVKFTILDLFKYKKGSSKKRINIYSYTFTDKILINKIL